MDSFGKISGYKVNWLKSKLMFMGENRTIGHCPFLGIKISKNYESSLTLNFDEGIEKLKRYINCWRTLPLSMVGRVNAIKMASYPMK